MKFLKSFRGKLLIVLAVIIIVILGAQYYLNLKTQEEVKKISEVQDQALLDGFSIGVNGMQQRDSLKDFIKGKGKGFYGEQTREKIVEILVIDNEWNVDKSLTQKYDPEENENGEFEYKPLSEVKDLPPLVETKKNLGEAIENFPNATTDENIYSDMEAHAIPVETYDQGRWHIMVILNNDREELEKLTAQPLYYLLALLLVSTIVTIALVWRFTRPITDLSNAAMRVADGDLDFRLDDARRSDEMGQLAKQFNEMTAGLAKTRDLQEQLQEAEKSAVVGRLASAIAHEIRNPLNYINLSLDHLRKKFRPEDESKQENFEKLTKQLKIEVDRINQQISDFLRYSRPTKLEIHSIDIRETIEDSLRIVEPQAAEQNIKISLVEEENVSNALGDANVLRSVFNNLFINAIHAMEKNGGKLTVKLSSEADYVKINISDTGEGIPFENLEKIFEPYFSTKETGTGLGLAIVKKIVDDHNGKIEVESEENQGTEFTVKLPKQ